MPRIRTLKPELPTDRKLAQVSIAARYTFVLCITQADDEGLLRAEPREILASLYPHDSNVTPELLAGWIGELTDRGFLRGRETIDGARVLEICNWKKHQKIDHPGSSRIGPLAKASRALREDSATSSPLDLGSRTMDLGPESKALVELRSTLSLPIAAVEANTSDRRARERALRAAAEVVFAYWKAQLGKNGRVLLDRKRETRLVERLRENEADLNELLYAVDGALRDDWLMGRAPNSERKYDGIEHIFRDRAQVERLATSVPGRVDRHPFLEQQYVST